MREAYGRFLAGVKPGGLVVACSESPQLVRVLDEERLGAVITTYGRTASADYRVEIAAGSGREGTDFGVIKSGRAWAAGTLGIPGAHNVLNACATLAVVDALGGDVGTALGALAEFGGVKRRFEVKGQAHGVIVVDDYAHHPTQIRATLAAARERYGDRRLWAVFQPHTYSRVEALLDEFTGAFGQADSVIVMDVYAARSSEVPTISSGALAGLIQHRDARYIAGQDEIVSTLLEDLREGDVLLTLGAGDGYRVGERVLEALTEMDMRQ